MLRKRYFLQQRHDRQARRRSPVSQAAASSSPAAAAASAKAWSNTFAGRAPSVCFVDIAGRRHGAVVERLRSEGAHAPHFIRCDLRDIEALRAAIAEARERAMAHSQCWSTMPAMTTAIRTEERDGRLLGQSHAGQPAPPVLRRAGRSPADARRRAAAPSSISVRSPGWSAIPIARPTSPPRRRSAA